MKHFITVLALAALSGCSLLHGPIRPMPKGAIACGNDYQCPTSMRCGFPDVDTHLQCMPRKP